MAAQGDFVERRDGQQERRVFLIRGTDLEVGGESISSEWTTDSEAEQALQAQKEGSRGLLEVPWCKDGKDTLNAVSCVPIAFADKPQLNFLED
eukprot:s8531_g4.t1